MSQLIGVGRRQIFNMLISPQLFRLWLGVTEYLFRNPELLEEALDTAIDDNTFRSDDLEFTFAARVSNANRMITLPHFLLWANHDSFFSYRLGQTVCLSEILNPTVIALSGLPRTLPLGSLRLHSLVTR
jgi:hypothetical protein